MKKGLCILIALLSLLTFALGVKKEIKKEIREEGSKIRVIDHDGKENRILSEFFEEGLACLRNLFIEGDDAAGFPSLQEFSFNDSTIDIENEIFSLKADITNFKIHGLGNFTINKVDLNIIGLIFDYDLEFHMTTSGEYANGEIKIVNIIDVQGDGDLNLEMVINPLGHARIILETIAPQEWVIQMLEYYGFILVRPNFHITGIMHDEELSSAISKQISNLIQQYVGENAEASSQQMSPIIMEILNDLIKDPDSALQDLIILAMEHCPAAKFFVEMLHGEAVKQGFIKN